MSRPPLADTKEKVARQRVLLRLGSSHGVLALPGPGTHWRWKLVSVPVVAEDGTVTRGIAAQAEEMPRIGLYDDE